MFVVRQVKFVGFVFKYISNFTRHYADKTRVRINLTEYKLNFKCALNDFYS